MIGVTEGKLGKKGTTPPLKYGGEKGFQGGGVLLGGVGLPEVCIARETSCEVRLGRGEESGPVGVEIGDFVFRGDVEGGALGDVLIPAERSDEAGKGVFPDAELRA